jgi:putative spermidine/putrescine transport system permease protein
MTATAPRAEPLTQSQSQSQSQTLTQTRPLPQPSRASRRPGSSAKSGWLGIAPFLGFAALFLGLPLAGLLISALQVPVEGAIGQTEFGLGNMAASVSGSAGTSLLNSLVVSAVAAAVGSIVGLAVTVAIVSLRSERANATTSVLAGVLANSGGISLAFSFIVVLGSTGFITQAFELEASGFSLYSPGGLVLMYQYFLVPTMVMLCIPAMTGIRKEWKEAAASAGAPPLQFWLRVGIPLLTPAALGGFVLLFGASFATHVSAAALIGGANYPLVTLKIAGLLAGGNASGQENVAMALSINMVIVAALTLAVYLPLQKRSRQWLSH